MPWNSTIADEYSSMLSGNIGQALELSSDTTIPAWVAEVLIITYLQKLETGYYEELVISPDHQNYLTYSEMRTLHCMRAACCMYAERTGIFPWRLTDKSVNELRPLLSINYQGLYRTGSRYYFESVWDCNHSVDFHTRQPKIVLNLHFCE